ncbi:hypothetical protein U8527_06595 [Kordia algicida OT-1]|uniref:Uncharacterized protein n=1 Tax=Kordia algicida OT-1 TaxID=391587 RepID=A9E1Z5_9FLAO|nr:hypothetical protein [Kordia algicida]EDP95694.1 hypothetical protein KAOT1_22621 [Kordia algicida OT-1]
MQNNIDSIISAITIIKKENPNSEAITLLENALKKSMQNYILDMAAMGTVVDVNEIKKIFKNGLDLLETFKK